MHIQFALILGLIVTLTVCGLAWARGAPAERWGALIVLVGTIVYPLIQLLLPPASQPVVYLLCEGIYGLSFLLLALRYASLWLGGAMLLQAMQFSLHAYYIVGERPHDRTYGLVNNLNSIGVLICILLGIVVSWRKRARGAK
ncbi:hypothetical protein [Caulobacter sp. DWR2-3-1b2]|uniref:hypothetical protein n=1 Tax=unclassified Caulobacter TaxID=2648921 RepID=UPI003CE6F7BF